MIERTTWNRLAAGLLAGAAALSLASCSQIDPNDPAAYSPKPQAAEPSASATAAPSTVKQTPRAVTPSAAVSNANGTVTCSYPAFGAAVRPVKVPTTTDIPAKGTETFELDTSAGALTFTSDRAATPCSTHSLDSLAKQSFYDGTTCHRLVTEGPYLLQCGDPSGTGRGGPGYVSVDELKGAEKYPAGTVALANPGTPSHNGSQLFFIYRDSDIPAQYTIVGKLDAASLEVLRKAAEGGHDNSDPNGGGKPSTEFVIKRFAPKA